MKPTQDLILSWLKARLKPDSLAWLGEKASQLASGTEDKHVYAAFSGAVRQTGKANLELGSTDLKAAAALVEGWNPEDWSADQAARIFLLLALPDGTSPRLCQQMYETADVGEAVALIKALPLLADPGAHMPRAREAIRSNIKLVYEAITLRNPYAALHFDETGWNQMVVKSFFMESPLEKAWGLDRRANAALSRMLTDLAYERWAAGRTFSPLLWRCVGPCADALGLEALAKALATASSAERNAAALALKNCPVPEAAKILASDPARADAAASGKLTWENYDRA